MLNDSLTQLFLRDLDKLKAEVQAFPDEASLWKILPGITNAAGNLTLHLIGNLNHFIGATLGNSGYIRERDKEFSSKDIPRELLIQHIDALKQVIEQTLVSLSNADLDKIYPIEVFGAPLKTSFFLLHLTTHLNYHLGQINYLRRIIETG